MLVKGATGQNLVTIWSDTTIPQLVFKLLFAIYYLCNAFEKYCCIWQWPVSWFTRWTMIPIVTSSMLIISSKSWHTSYGANSCRLLRYNKYKHRWNKRITCIICKQIRNVSILNRLNRHFLNLTQNGHDNMAMTHFQINTKCRLATKENN